MRALSGLGIRTTEANIAITSDSGVVILECLRAGYGLSLLPAALCAPIDGLEAVLPELPTPSIPVWLVTHRELQTSRRIRVVFDHLAHGLMQVSRS